MNTKRFTTIAAQPLRWPPCFASPVLWMLVSVGAGCETNYYTTHVHPDPGAREAGAGDASVRDVADSGDAQTPDANSPDATDGGAVPIDGGAIDGDATRPPADAGPRPLANGAPLVNTTRLEQTLDVFGSTRNHYWFIVPDEELERMNERYGGGGPIFIRHMNDYGDIYTPGGPGDAPTFVEHLLVTDASGATADYGKLEVKLVGESTGRPWTERTLPNLKIDADEFVEKLRVGDVEHLRLNNAVVGSIFREKFAFDYYRALGYPAPRATYGRVSSTVWGPGIAVPYLVVEVYKRPFCERWEDHFAGGCVNMWELSGDFGYGVLELPESCQFSECETARVSELEQLVLATPEGTGYKEALDEWVAWDEFHQFQCLSWLFATGDDALHNMNNWVLVERADGKFQYLPYSVDISFGQDWYQTVPLAGTNTLARGCQSDAQCWADTIATCEVLLEEFVEADPLERLEQLRAQLEDDDMLRPGDDRRYDELKDYLERRLQELPEELELNRETPQGVDCEPPLMLCGDYCALPEECYLCDPGGQPLPEPWPIRHAGAPALALGAPLLDAGASLTDAGATDGETTEVQAPDAEADAPPGEPGEPQTCLPYVELYRAR